MSADLLASLRAFGLSWADVLVAWGVTGLVGGALVGWRRNRWIAGPFAGLVLGPVGWWWVCRLPGRWRDCPACSRPIDPAARTCPRCGADVQRSAARSARSELKGRLGGDGR